MDTKFQKKHESDMTRKEKRELEREKLASMHGLEKAEYILAYYKYHILGLILIVLAIVGIIKWAGTLKNEDYLYAMIVNAPEGETAIMDDFREEIGDDDKYHQYSIDTSIFLMENAEGEQVLDSSAQMKLTTLVGAQVVDVLICPKDVYESYRSGDVLYQMKDLMGEEFVTEHKDTCLEDAILIEDSATLEKYGLLPNEPSYIIVFGYAKYPEVVKEFVDFVVD